MNLVSVGAHIWHILDVSGLWDETDVGVGILCAPHPVSGSLGTL